MKRGESSYSGGVAASSAGYGSGQDAPSSSASTGHQRLPPLHSHQPGQNHSAAVWAESLLTDLASSVVGTSASLGWENLRDQTLQHPFSNHRKAGSLPKPPHQQAATDPSLRSRIPCIINYGVRKGTLAVTRSDSPRRRCSSPAAAPRLCRTTTFRTAPTFPPWPRPCRFLLSLPPSLASPPSRHSHSRAALSSLATAFPSHHVLLAPPNLSSSTLMSTFLFAG